MLRSICKTLMIVLATAVIGGTASGATTDAGYRINGGDLLHISVYGEENLNQDVAVQPDGWIAFPLVGNLDARGLTLKELQTKIAANLRESQYFPNLTDNEVTVSMVKATGNSVSVVGQVKQPGTFAFDTQLDVMQALSLAGGLTPFADKDEIKVLRRDAAGVQTAILFDYSQAEEGQKLDQNILLRGGDVVVVPQGGLF
jgi:polysaccharide biosynthesis/export protein